MRVEKTKKKEPWKRKEGDPVGGGGGGGGGSGGNSGSDGGDGGGPPGCF